jgi:hypothetical protein
MRLYLVNPDNPVVSLTDVKWSRLNRYRIWKPLGLLVLAGLTPPEWEVTVLDENLARPDYTRLPRPDLVGITAFTSQAPRAYEIAAFYRGLGVPVVLGGIHATFCREEALQHADAVVTGEAEGVWCEVLGDALGAGLRPVYAGGHSAMAEIPAARHHLQPGQYVFGAVQTTRGCPLNCSICSVMACNGGTFRHRPVEAVSGELRLIRERLIPFVDDNLIGIRREHVAYSKALFLDAPFGPAHAQREDRADRARGEPELPVQPTARPAPVCPPAANAGLGTRLRDGSESGSAVRHGVVNATPSRRKRRDVRFTAS